MPTLGLLDHLSLDPACAFIFTIVGPTASIKRNIPVGSNFPVHPAKMSNR